MKRYVCFPSHGNGIFIGDGVKTTPITNNYWKGYTNREWNRPYVLEIEEMDMRGYRPYILEYEEVNNVI